MTLYGPPCNCGSPRWWHIHGVSSTTNWSYRVPVEPLQLWPPTEEQAADTPLPTTSAADTSATPTSEETPVPETTESPVTVDVTGEVSAP